MASQSRLLAFVRDLRLKEIQAELHEKPSLIEHRDGKGRNWLHLACAVDVKERGLKASASIKTADLLLKAGLEINAPAFEQGGFKATPLWYAVAHGKNYKLAEHLLERGADPNYCLFAAAYNDDAATIRLLMRYEAPYPVGEGESPFLAAIMWDRLAAAEALLEVGADVKERGPRGKTALHIVLDKRMDRKHVEMLISHGARGNIADRGGRTAIALMMRKRDPAYHALARTLAP